jgi:hypothetical protein
MKNLRRILGLVMVLGLAVFALTACSSLKEGKDYTVKEVSITIAEDSPYYEYKEMFETQFNSQIDKMRMKFDDGKCYAQSKVDGQGEEQDKWGYDKDGVWTEGWEENGTYKVDGKDITIKVYDEEDETETEMKGKIDGKKITITMTVEDAVSVTMVMER